MTNEFVVIKILKMKIYFSGIYLLSQTINKLKSTKKSPRDILAAARISTIAFSHASLALMKVVAKGETSTTPRRKNTRSLTRSVADRRGCDEKARPVIQTHTHIHAQGDVKKKREKRKEERRRAHKRARTKVMRRAGAKQR